MTEISELSRSFYSSDNDSSTSEKEDSEIENNHVKSYSIRCEKCYSNAIIQKAEFMENIFVVKCNNNHIFNYKSYTDFIDNTNKNLFHLLCHNCQNPSNKNKNLLKCKECNLFICKDCKPNHMHSNFIELKNIDKEINNNIIFDSLYSLDINKEYQITLENINLVKNIKKNMKNG